MNTFYTQIKTKLSEVKEVKFIDLQRGQMQAEEVSTPFPAVFVNLDSLINFRELSTKSELATIEVVFQVCFMNQLGTDNVKNKELSSWLTLQKIWAKLQTLKFKRISLTKENRNDFQVFNFKLSIAKHNLII